MTINRDLIDLFNKFDKPFFTVLDARRLLNTNEKETSVYLSRLVKARIIERLKPGVYRVFNRTEPIEKIACDLYYPSYVSFYYALGNFGILNQKAYQISIATTKKSWKTKLDERAIEFRHLKPELFFGYYTTRDGYYEAYPEKALLDELYVCSLGKDHLDFEELNLVDLQKKRFKEYLKAYPPKTKRLVKREILPRWGTVSVTIR